MIRLFTLTALFCLMALPTAFAKSDAEEMMDFARQIPQLKIETLKQINDPTISDKDLGEAVYSFSMLMEWGQLNRRQSRELLDKILQHPNYGRSAKKELLDSIARQDWPLSRDYDKVLLSLYQANDRFDRWVLIYTLEGDFYHYGDEKAQNLIKPETLKTILDYTIANETCADIPMEKYGPIEDPFCGRMLSIVEHSRRLSEKSKAELKARIAAMPAK